MRAVEAALKSYQSASEGKAKLIATHGNRFVLHMIFRSFNTDQPIDLNEIRPMIGEAVRTTLDQLIEATMKLYEASYPSNLFKNLKKCRDLAEAIQQEHSAPKQTRKRGRARK